MSLPPYTKIHIQVSVAVKLEKSWAYYTEAQHITQWNFASPDWCCPSASNSLEVGEGFNWRMEAKDGSVGFDFGGKYTELVYLKKIAYILPDLREVQITFTPAAKGTSVDIVFDAENENSLALQKSGWQSILDQYKTYTEAN
ncbi:MAG: SRPBCC domain-containing protein [Algoriphagus sp.]